MRDLLKRLGHKESQGEESMTRSIRYMQPIKDAVPNGAGPTFLDHYTPIVVGPEQAQRWLTEYAYPRQRPLRPTHVRELIQVMRDGLFTPTPVELAHCRALDRTFLVNGQHRLTAIRDGGIAQRLYVIEHHVETERELDELYGRLDRGAIRSVNDVVRASGVADEMEAPPAFVTRIGPAVALLATEWRASAEAQAYRRVADYRIQGLRDLASEIAFYYHLLRGAGNRALRRRLIAAGPASVALATLRDQAEGAAAFW